MNRMKWTIRGREGGEDKKTRGEEEARHETKAKKHRMLCLGPAHRRLVAATQVSNTNSLLTLNSNALPTESFVTPFADWSGFFWKRECPCISLCPQDILAAQRLCYLNPLRFCFSPPTHCWIFFPLPHPVPNTHWQVDRRESNAGQTILCYSCNDTNKKWDCTLTSGKKVFSTLELG